ncbi:MAG: hypothetical protein QW222_04595 [Candidatus Bathyarchaeia archaeon]
MESKAIGLLRKIESIRNRAQKVYEDFEELDELLIQFCYKRPFDPFLLSNITNNVANCQSSKLTETKMILEEYFSLSSEVYEVTKMVLPHIPKKFSNVDEAKGVLHRIIIQCDGFIGLLNSYVVPISAEDADRLNKLRIEVSDVTAVLDINFEKNLIEAINECEKGHYLASALITARVINYALDQISGQTIEDKIKFLQNQNIIKKSEKGRTEEEEFIMKASKKARNIFSHDIKIFASPSDSLGMLGDCLRLLKMLKLLGTG